MQPRPTAGFSLVDLLVAMALLALLAAVALPSMRDAVQRARRSDALVPLMALQQSQERWRSSHPAYASLGELALPSTSPQGLYQRDVLAPSATGYSVTLEALGSQRDDASCRFLRIDVAAGEARTSSGATADRRNPPDADRRCWGRP